MDNLPLVTSLNANEALLNVRGLKVGLGPYRREHVDILWSYLQHPEVGIFAGGTFRVTSLEQAIARYEQDVTAQDKVTFALYQLENLTLIGTVILRQIDLLNGTASLGISIEQREVWGKGYGTEAVKLAVDFGFRFKNLHNISLYTTSFNTRAIRAYEKAGFKLFGKRREAVLLAGKRYDELHMECLVSEFESPTPGWFSL